MNLINKNLFLSFLLMGCSSDSQTVHSQPSVVGGKPIEAFSRKNEALGFMASLSTQSGIAFCSGIFITPQIVLTAAHCFRDRSGEVPALVNIGSSSLNNAHTGILSQLPHVSHPSFGKGSSSELFGDIALIKLSKAFPGVKPALLADPATPPLSYGTPMWHVGYGLDIDNPSDETNMPLKFVDTKYGNLLTPTGEFMTTFSTKKGICSGDSGGPVLRDSDLAVEGIVSQGMQGDCELGSGFFTDVRTYRPFIDCVVDILTPENATITAQQTAACAALVKVPNTENSLLRTPFNSESATKNIPMIALMHARGKKAFCTGIALNSLHVLTSAQCLRSQEPADLIATWTFDKEAHPTLDGVAEIEKFTAFPGSEDVKAFNTKDLAVLKLKQPLQGNFTYPTLTYPHALLPKQGTTTQAFFVGLGRKTESITQPDPFMGVARPLFHGPEAGAEDLILVGPSWRKGLHLEFDKGAPLFTESAGSLPVLTGIATNASRRVVAGSRSIGFFVDLRNYTEWILENIK